MENINIKRQYWALLLMLVGHFCAFSATYITDSNYRIYCDELMVSPGIDQEVTLYLTNPARIKHSFQVDMVLPANLEPIANLNGCCQSLTEAQISSYYLAAKHTLRILAVNTTSLPAQHDLPFAKIKLRASSAFTGGTIHFSNFIFALASSGVGRYGATVNVGVTSIILTSGISLSSNNASVLVGKTLQLTATVTPSNANNKAVAWHSSDTSIATVSDKGVVTGVKVGTATITATTTDGTNLSASCRVTVNPVLATSVTLNKSSETLLAGESVQLTATVLPENTTNKKLTWSSSDTRVVLVDQNGNVTAKEEGEAIISARTTDGSNLHATCGITVKPLCSLMADTVAYLRGTTNAMLELPITIENPVVLSGLQFDVILPNSVELAMNNGNPDVWLEQSRVSGNHTVDVALQSTTSSGKKYRVLVSSPTGLSLKGNTGVLLHMNLIAQQYLTKTGIFGIKYSNIIFSTPDEVEYKQNEMQSWFSYEYMVGDANADVAVDVADYVVTAAKILNRNVNGWYFSDAADVNQSSDVNVTDLVGITNLSLGRRPIWTRRVPMTDYDLSFEVNGIVSDCDDGLLITINMNNDRDVSGMQFDLVLPEGLALYSTQSCGRADGLNIQTGLMQDGAVRVLLSDFNMQDIASGSGEVARIKLSGLTKDWSERISFNNVVVVERNLAEHKLESLDLEMCSTGLSNLSADQVRIWGENGRIVIESPEPGMAYCIGVDGVSMPLTVKAGRNEYPMDASGVAIVKMGRTVVKIRF